MADFCVKPKEKAKKNGCVFRRIFGCSCSNWVWCTNSPTVRQFLAFSWWCLFAGFLLLLFYCAAAIFVGVFPASLCRIREFLLCFLRVLAAMIFGTSCGGLTAFTVLYLWTIFANKRGAVVPEGCSMQTLDVEYRKVKILVDNKTIGDGNK